MHELAEWECRAYGGLLIVDMLIAVAVVEHEVGLHAPPEVGAAAVVHRCGPQV